MCADDIPQGPLGGSGRAQNGGPTAEHVSSLALGSASLLAPERQT